MPIRKTEATFLGNPVYVWDEIEDFFPDKAVLLVPPEILIAMLEQQERQTMADCFLAEWQRGFR